MTTIENVAEILELRALCDDLAAELEIFEHVRPERIGQLLTRYRETRRR